MNRNAKERLVYVDVVAGLMIGWMILGHCTFFSHYKLSFFKFLSFYMPWFFYKSGMFFSVKNQTVLLKKDASKLIRNFLVYSLIGWIVWCVCGLTDNSLTLRACIVLPVHQFLHHGSITANGALWFLLSLFAVRQFSNWILKTKITPPLYL